MTSPAIRKPLGFVPAAVGGGLGTVAGGWFVYLVLSEESVLIGAWVGGVIGTGLGVALAGYAGGLTSALGVALVWLLAAVVGSIPLTALLPLLFDNPGPGAEQAISSVIGFWGGGIAGIVGRSISWGVGGAIRGFPEDDQDA